MGCPSGGREQRSGNACAETEEIGMVTEVTPGQSLQTMLAGESQRMARVDEQFSEVS